MATQRLQNANSKRQKEEVWPGNSCTWSCHKSFLTSSSSPYNPLKLPFGEYLFTGMYFNLTLLTYNSGPIRSHTQFPHAWEQTYLCRASRNHSPSHTTEPTCQGDATPVAATRPRPQKAAVIPPSPNLLQHQGAVQSQSRQEKQEADTLSLPRFKPAQWKLLFPFLPPNPVLGQSLQEFICLANPKSHLVMLGTLMTRELGKCSLSHGKWILAFWPTYNRKACLPGVRIGTE